MPTNNSSGFPNAGNPLRRRKLLGGFKKLALMLPFLPATHVQAIIHDPGIEGVDFTSQEELIRRSREHCEAGENFPYWKYVGTMGNSSGVFLGGKGAWVITAAHVGKGPITLGEKTYQPKDPDSDPHFFEKDPGASGVPDVCMFQIDIPEGDDLTDLEPINIGGGNPGEKSGVVLIGNGLGAGQTVSETSVKWGDDDYRKRWGLTRVKSARNTSHTRESGEDGEQYDTQTFKTEYAADGCGATPGDSGGGCFGWGYPAGGKGRPTKRWRLYGIIVGVSEQNKGHTTFGDETGILSIAKYRTQIYDTMSGNN